MKRSCAPSKKVGSSAAASFLSLPVASPSCTPVIGTEIAPKSPCQQSRVVTSYSECEANILGPPADAEVFDDAPSENKRFCSSANSGDFGGCNDASDGNAMYFMVVWGKASTRKHKRYDEDAVLVVRKRTLTLHDMTGKVIGQVSAFPLKQLVGLDCGSQLMLSGKDIEIQSRICHADYASGACFSVSASKVADSEGTLPAAHCVPPSAARRQFILPFKNGNVPPGVAVSSPKNHAQLLVTPGEHTFVLPRPSPRHMLEHNANNLPLTEVVIDACLSRHLRPHQREGVIFLYECVMGMREQSSSGGNPIFGAILADDMGLGKSLQCLTVLWALLRVGPYGGKPVINRAMIVVPSSLVQNWVAEIRKWLGDERLRPIAVQSAEDVKRFAAANPRIHPVLIISYEMFMRCYEQYFTDQAEHSLHFDLLICDEAHRLKNIAIKTNSLLTSLCVQRKILLSGTPVQNDLQELYALSEFTNPAIFGSSTSFKRTYEDPIGRGCLPNATPANKALGEQRALELAAITRLFLLRRTQEINQKYLPSKVDYVVVCRPSITQLEIYNTLLSSRSVQNCTSVPQHFVIMDALRKLCNHPMLLYNAVKNRCEQELTEDTDGEPELLDSLYQDLSSALPSHLADDNVDVADSGKMSVAYQLLVNIRHKFPDQRVVVVSNFTQTLNLLESLCEASGFSTLRLDGSTPTAKRLQIVKQFNTAGDKTFVFLLSSKAGGVGLNLIGASRLILYDVDWNPANDLQSMARIWRDGQKHSVHIYRLLTAGTIEEKMFQRQVRKQGLSGSVIDVQTLAAGVGVGAKNYTQFTMEDLRDLFTLHVNTDCGTHDLLGCHCGATGEPISSGGVDVVEEETQEERRDCQLGAEGRNDVQKKTPATMAELLEWRHVGKDHLKIPLLDQACLQNCDNVSFVLQHSSVT